MQIFFCVSGFLIAHSFSRRSKIETEPTKNFFIRRFFRIIPVWWVVLFAMFAGNLINTEVMLINMFFIFGFLMHDRYFAPVPASWSLFVEECYYLFFPLIFSRFRIRGLIIAFFTLAIISRIWLRSAQDWGIPSTNGFIFKIPISNLQFFFAGMILEEFYQAQNKVLSFTKSLDFGSLLVILTTCFYPDFLPRELTVAIVFATCLNPKTYLVRFIDFKFLRWAGVRCYFIYIAHGPIRMLTQSHVVSWLENLGEGPSSLKVISHFTILVMITLVGALLSFKFIEMPSMKLAERLLKK